MKTEDIKFSTGHTLESFNKNNGVCDIGQFNSDDKKLLRRLVNKGLLIQFKRQWFPNMGTLRNAWVKSDSPQIMRHDKENGLLWFNY